MKLINPKAEYLPQANGLEGVYKQIELCGRTCYKSESKITEDSAKPFVDRMISSNHTAMLEHGTVYLFFGDNVEDSSYYYDKYYENEFSRVNYDTFGYVYVTTNLRVLVENDWLEDLKYICEPTKYHERRFTFKFITDRGVSHELVRHRTFSFAQESTRYCNYSKDKFGNEITFIIPSWSISIHPDVLIHSPFEITPKEAEFMQACFDSEKRYFNMLNSEATPQEARQVLPNALKTEIVMTGFASDWKHFFDLRYFGTTGAPHPDMKKLTTLAVEEATKTGIWNYIYEKTN